MVGVQISFATGVEIKWSHDANSFVHLAGVRGDVMSAPHFLVSNLSKPKLPLATYNSYVIVIKHGI